MNRIGLRLPYEQEMQVSPGPPVHHYVRAEEFLEPDHGRGSHLGPSAVRGWAREVGEPHGKEFWKRREAEEVRRAEKMRAQLFCFLIR